MKCDEIHPVCTKCVIHRFACDWPTSQTGSPNRSSATRLSPLRFGQSKRATATLHPNRFMPLAPSLKESHIQCANSLTLTTQDKHLWNFFPSTTFFAIYDFGGCSLFRYLTSELANSSSIIMSMILATSASEMHKRGLNPIQDSRTSVDGLHHYNVALNHLQTRLACTKNESNVEVLLASIFFMLNYEIQFPTSTSAPQIKTHLEGLWALISTHPIFHSQDPNELVPETPQSRTTAANLSLSCQLILWCLYVNPFYPSNLLPPNLLPPNPLPPNPSLPIDN